MPIWRSPDLEAIFGGPLDESGITEQSLAQLVADHARESERLDFKQSLYSADRKFPEWGPEFAKDVAAFANHVGGAIVFGIKDDDGTAVDLLPFSVEKGTDAESRQLLQALTNFQAPIAERQFVWVPASGDKCFLVVLVPPSRRSPHAVVQERKGGSLKYPQRRERDTTWLTESEVAERYRRRATFYDDERRRLEEVIEEGLEPLRRSSATWFYAALVPERETEDRLDAATVKMVEEWHGGAGFVEPLGRSLNAYGLAIPGPGRVTFTERRRGSQRDEPEVEGTYVELHLAGSAFAATPIGEETDGEGNPGVVGENTLVGDVILAVDLITQWAAHRAGPLGTATLVAGLPVFEGGPPLSLYGVDAGQLRRISTTRLVRKSAQAKVSVDLAAVGTVQERLAVSYHVLARLLHWFGLSEPRHLTAEGLVVPEAFERGYRQAEEWAINLDVNGTRIRGR